MAAVLMARQPHDNGYVAAQRETLFMRRLRHVIVVVFIQPDNSV
jgi:hypothetical protein